MLTVREPVAVAAGETIQPGAHPDDGGLIVHVVGVSVDPTGLATAAKQDTGNSALAALAAANHTDLAAILAKIIAAPATAANQATEITALGLLATAAAQTTANASLASILAALIPTVSATYGASVFANHGANATLNVKAGAGNVYAFGCSNANAATRYIQIHNTATVPGGGAVPLLSFPIAGAAGGANGFTLIDTDTLTKGGVYFDTGIAFAFSTTQATYTAATAGEQDTQVFYK